MSKLRIGIVSFEHMHALSYAEALRSNPVATLVAISETDAERRVMVSEKFSDARIYTSHEELIASSEVDGVIICTKNSDHGWTAKLAAKAGKHILCEKPLAPTVKEAQEIIDTAKSAGVTLMTAFPVRFSPAVARLREDLQTGKFGKLLGACTTNHGSMPGGWFVDASKSGGGAVIDHTVHVVDALRWAFDDEVAEVSAVYDTRLHDLDVDDVGQLIMRFSKGTIVSLDTSWSRPKSYHTWGDVKLEVKGELATATINCFPLQINHFDDRTMKHGASGMGEDSDRLMIEEFAAAVSQKREPLVTGTDGLKAVEVALAAYESGRQGGKPVTIQ